MTARPRLHIRSSPILALAFVLIGTGAAVRANQRRARSADFVTVGYKFDTCGVPLAAVQVRRSSYDSAFVKAVAVAHVFTDTLHAMSLRARQQSSSAGISAAERAGAQVQGSSMVAARPNPFDSAAMSIRPLYPQVFTGNDSSHAVGDDTRRLLTANAASLGLPTIRDWVCGSSPEFQDAQRLINADSTFGPVVQVVAPATARLKITQAEFTGKYVLVAIAVVRLDSATDAAAYQRLDRYTRLGLQPGDNCVYLGFIGNAWSSKVAQPQAPQTCESVSLASRPTLSVVPTEFGPIDSIPAATRIVEGPNMMPYIGTRCAGAWCVIGARSINELLQPGQQVGMSDPNAPPSTIRTSIDPWFDEQHLAVWDSARSRLVAKFRASIIPDTGLRNPARDYTKGYLPVASVWADDNPPAEYHNKWGYSKGWNRIYLMHVPSAPPDTIWMALIVDSNNSSKVIPVHKFMHVIGPTQGTARWDWTDIDEWVWVPCELGCCLVDNGRDTQ